MTSQQLPGKAAALPAAAPRRNLILLALAVLVLLVALAALAVTALSPSAATVANGGSTCAGCQDA